MDAHFRELGSLAVDIVRALHHGLDPPEVCGLLSGGPFFLFVLLTSSLDVTWMARDFASDRAGTASRRLIGIIATPPAALSEGLRPECVRFGMPGHGCGLLEVTGLSLKVSLYWTALSAGTAISHAVVKDESYSGRRRCWIGSHGGRTRICVAFSHGGGPWRNCRTGWSSPASRNLNQLPDSGVAQSGH